MAAQRLLERDRELAQLRSLVDDVCAGDGRSAVLEAPAGIGKTRLIEAIRAMAAERGARVLSARGSEREREYPFGLVRQLLEPAVAEASSERRRALFSGAASLAQPVFDFCSSEPLPVDPGYATLHGLYWLLVALAAGEPTLVTIDDLHWSDAPSSRFLSFLRQRLDDLPVAVLVATRPRERGCEHGLLDEFARDLRADPIRPGPLSERAVAQLVSDALRDDPDPTFSSACWQSTGGNAFFLSVLLAELAREGVAPTEARATRVRGLGPDAVLRSILVRLATLPSGALALAQAVAVLGDGAAVHQAAELAALEVSTAIDAAEALVRTGLFSDSERLMFAHPIVRTALYQDLTASRRAQRHAQAARLLAQAGASDDEIAAHLLLVAPGIEPTAQVTLQRAARRALTRGAPEVAATYLERALAEPCEGRERAEMLLELGVAEAHAGSSDCVEHLASAVQQATEPRARVTAAMTLARVLAAANRATESVAVLTELADDLADLAPELAASVEAELLSLGDIELSVRGLTEPMRTHSRDLRGRISVTSPGSLVHQAVDASLAGTSAVRAAALAAQGLADGKLLAEALAGGQLFFLSTTLMIYAEAYEQAASFLDQAMAQAVSQGSALGFIGASTVRSLLNTRRGALAEAEADARAAVAAASLDNWPMWRLQAGTMLASALLERGDVGSAGDELDGLEAEAGFATATQGTVLLETRGRVRLDLGDTDLGVADLLECGHRFERWGLLNPAAFAWRSNAALGLNALGQPARAAVLARQEVALARIWGSPRALGVALRAQGLISGRVHEVPLLTESVTMLESSDAQVEHARALIDLGAALRRAKQRTAAREPLRAGLELAHSCGARALAERAHTELAASGARPRSPLRTGLDSLSPSELRIARMAASGQNNPTIAQALFVTVKTVEMHLTSTYRKLNVASRAELTGALERPGQATSVLA